MQNTELLQERRVKSKEKRLLISALINISITVVQMTGGILSNSLSLLSDAIHNLGDSLSIFLAFAATKISHRKPDRNYTFGYNRAETLAALLNSAALIIICLFMVIEASRRFTDPQPVKGLLMLIIASFGLLANFVSVLILNKEKENSLNVKAAYLHLIGDTLSSVLVIVAGLIIMFFGIAWIDPVITLIISIYIMYGSWPVLKETISILMQAVPGNIDPDLIRSEVEKIEGIENIHHLHIWKLDEKHIYMEAHLNISENVSMSGMMKIKEQAENMIHNRFNIRHITLQTGINCCNGSHDLIVTNRS